jgi:hypothetical protein
MISALFFIFCFLQAVPSQFNLIVPKNVSIAEKEDIINFIERKSRILEEEWNLKLKDKIKIISYPSVYEFMRNAKASKSNSGIFIENVIHLQPIDLLKRKSLLYPALSHELAHASLYRYSREGLPFWLNESFAIYFSNEISKLKKTKSLKLNHFKDLDRMLKNSKGDLTNIYFYLGLTMQFFINTYSHEKIILLLHSFNKNDPDEVISETLKESIGAIENKWISYLSKFK